MPKKKTYVAIGTRIRSLQNYVEDLQLRVAALETIVRRLDETRIPVVHASDPPAALDGHEPSA